LNISARLRVNPQPPAYSIANRKASATIGGRFSFIKGNFAMYIPGSLGAITATTAGATKGVQTLDKPGGVSPWRGILNDIGAGARAWTQYQIDNALYRDGVPAGYPAQYDPLNQPIYNPRPSGGSQTRGSSGDGIFLIGALAVGGLLLAKGLK
jgi:hypothetical protein